MTVESAAFALCNNVSTSCHAHQPLTVDTHGDQAKGSVNVPAAPLLKSDAGLRPRMLLQRNDMNGVGSLDGNSVGETWHPQICLPQLICSFTAAM